MRWGIQATCIVLLLCIAAVGAFGMPVPVNQLPEGCTAGTSSCTKTSDVTSGTCRTIKYNSNAGQVQVMVCDKGSAYELYRQAGPSSATVCVGGGCVDSRSGFSRFTATTLSTRIRAVSPVPTTPVCTPTTEICDGKDNNCNGQTDENNVCAPVPPAQPAPAPTGSVSPLLSGSSIGFGGQTRDQNFETMVDSWFRSQNVIQRIQTSQGTALWVPWMNRADASAEANLQRGGACTLATVNLENNCLVTDEFSQVGMVLAMSTRHQADFEQWFTTVKQLKGGKYGSLPVWRASRTANGISTAITGNQDSASDADARVIIALYTAANNDAFSASQKAAYKQYADTMAADMIKYDFAHVSKPGRNGVMINHWLASGAVTGTGAGLTWNDFSYGGYYGDVVLALLAAHKSTGNPEYVTYAKDTVNAYLLAANYNGATFSVPPKAFKWDTSGTTPKSVCTNNCGSSSWDDSDAVRAVTMCKAVYYAELNSVDLGNDLKSYCQSWMNSGGVQPTAYSIQYTFAGRPASPTVGGMYENGLGSSLNFYLNKGDLVKKLDEVASHYDAGRGTFDWSASDGVYRSAFYKVNLGSAIGRDLKVYTGSASVTTPTTPTTTPPPTTTTPPTTTPPPTTPTTGSTCATSVEKLSATCEGGSITSDTYNGCRTIVCGGTQVLACDKGSNFEMYKQSGGNSVTICIAGTCISDNGYAKSGSFPICAQSVTEPVAQQPTEPITTVIAAPATTLGALNVVCNVFLGGPLCTKISDVDNGCRTVKFSSNGQTEQVMICDKGTAYEMYSQVHSGQTNVCVGDACVGPMTGFARWNK